MSNPLVRDHWLKDDYAPTRTAAKATVDTMPTWLFEDEA